MNGRALEWNEYRVGDARNIDTLLGGKVSIDLTVTSPPYWDVKNYGSPNQIGYQQTLNQYLDDLVAVFTSIWKCTKPNGSLWIVMKSVKKDGRLHQLPFMLSERLTSLTTQSWQLQDVLVWHKTHTLPWSHKQKLTDNYEHILCFTKSDEFELRMEALRTTDGITNWWVKYPERYHPEGKALSNVWEIAIPTQGSWGNGHFDHFCPLPVELVKRIILLSTDKQGTVFDPFAGTGSVALAAQELGRKWLALDVNRKYRDMFHRRLANEKSEKNAGSQRGEVELATANIALRQLKFGQVLYKRIAPSLRLTAEDVPFIAIVAGQRQQQAKPHWVKGVKVVLVLSDKCHRARRDDISSAVAEQTGKAPLSKFQLDVTTSSISKSQFLKHLPFKPKQALHIYTRGAFWMCNSNAEPTDLKGMEPLGKMPTIISDILVREQPAY